jgi:hypothetical protein
MSPLYHAIILEAVTEQLNQQYEHFMQLHPDYKGGVSILAHSLGSAISYDLMCYHQQSPHCSTGNVAKAKSSTRQVPTLPEQVLKYSQSRAAVKLPPLTFNVDNLFMTGSPMPMVLSGIDTTLRCTTFIVSRLLIARFDSTWR